MGEHVERECVGDFTQHFNCLGYNTSYENRLLYEKAPNSVEQLQIKNHLIEIHNDIMVKVTQIQIGDQIIRIIDAFTCTPSNSNLKSKPVVEKHLKKKNSNKSKKTMTGTDQEFKIRQNRNVIKNIIGIFQNWVRENHYSDLILDVALDQFLKSHGKFDSKLMHKLSKDQFLRKAFIAFSQQEAENLIGKSRIRDKQSHVEAIQMYHKLCCQMLSVEQIDRRLSKEPSESSI